MNAKIVTLLLAATCVAGCTVGRTDRHAHLPFRVAVAPVQILQVGAEVAAAEPGPPGLCIALDAETIGHRIAEELGSRVFADGVAMPIGGVGREAGDGRDAALVREAIALHANLLLECELRVAPAVATAKNDRFWLNLVLFAIGGPASWFVPDRSYRFDVRLSAHLHEVEPLADGSASLEDRRARLVYAHAQVKEVDLDLLERAGGDVLPLLASIVVPAGFLETDGDAVRSVLEQEIGTLLAQELGRQFGELQHQIAEGGTVTDIGLSDVGIRREPDGLWFHGTAELRKGDANRLAGYVLRCGGERIEGSFDRDGESSSGGRNEIVRYPMSVRLPEGAVDSQGPYVDVELIAGGRDRARRSFCVPLLW